MRSLLLVLALVGCSAPGGFRSDWERDNLKAQAAEEQVDPPAYPAPGRLLEFGVLDAGGFHFFV
ncbi:MAG: hypothetical protein E6H57_01925, partial [Betaproteobacteria bacterium]